MKRLLLILSLLFCTVAFGATETINWYVGENLYDTTTCESGGDITLPTAPTKYGYTFQGWATYTPIEYLESTGTQYIDTGIVPTSVTQMRIKLKPMNNPNTTTYVFGAQDNTKFYFAINHTSKKYFFTSGSGLSIAYDNVLDIVDLTVKIDQDNRWTFYTETNSVTSNTVSSDRPQINMWLFANNYRNSMDTTEAIRVYFAQIYDNNTLVRDFIPVLDFAGIPCMYDRVEGKYYYNAGTGNFIAGPIIN